MKHLLAGILLCAPLFAASAAHAVTLTDSYAGGYAPPAHSGGTDGGTDEDVVGSNTFQINSLTAYRTADGSNPSGTLNIVISTYYAGMPEANASSGTGYGDLFITPGKNAWNPTTSGNCNDCNDVYKPGEWAYVATLPSDPTVAAQYPKGTGMFYSTAGNSQVAGSAVGSTTGSIASNGTGTGAYASLGTNKFGTGTGVVTSNVGSCEGRNTTSGCNTFRADQAVDYNPTAGQSGAVIDGFAITENYSIVAASNCKGSGSNMVCSTPGTITIQIVDNGLLGNDFAISWAMTCANDVIQGQVLLGPNDDPVDEPPTWAIVIAGLFSIAAYRRWRKRQDPLLLQYS